MATAIEISDLSKIYPQTSKAETALKALDHIHLNIREGEFFGLLGPNGAGKTTLIKTIVGLARITEGHIRVFGRDVEKEYKRTKALIGLSPQEPNTDRYFTVKRVLHLQGGYFGLPRQERERRTDEMLQRFGLSDKANTQYWRLSGGMQKRVMVARALMTQPRILILDEPTAGVDVEQRHELWDSLRGLNRDGTTIILTTHYMDEAEILCERVGIINFGRIVACAPPRDLIAQHCERYFRINGEKREQLEGFHVEDVEVNRGSLEEVFIKLTGRSLSQDEERKEAS